MERRLLNLNKVLALLEKQYNSNFFVVWKCVKEEEQLKNKAFITIFQDIIAVIFDESNQLYKVSYNFNNKFWNKYVDEDGHGLAFSPVFNKEDMIEMNGESYIDENIIIKWDVFTLAELGSLC